MSETAYTVGSRKSVRIVSREATDLFDGCHVVGDSHDLAQHKSDLKKAIEDEDLPLFRRLLGQCRGVFWGWVKKKQKFYLFTDAWGCARVYVADMPGDAILIFESYSDVKEVLRLSTTFERVSAYLTFSYVPGKDTLFKDVWGPSPGAVHELGENGWITHGKFDNYSGAKEEMGLEDAAKEFAERISRAVGRALDGPVVISLSGGLDSRALLAAALEHQDASDIHTFTFGSPGSLDYELGNRVARRAGTHHTSYPLSIDDYSVPDLRASADECFGQMFFCTEAPLRIFEEQAQHGAPFLMGFMGDPQAGVRIKLSYENKSITDDWRETLFADHVLNTPEEILPLFTSPPVNADELRRTLIDEYVTAEPFPQASDFIQLNDNWDFYNRQWKYITYCVSKNVLEGNRYVYPFLDPEVVAFSRRLPNAHRLGSAAYRRGLIERWPKLFALPAAAFFGGRCTWHPQSRFAKLWHAGLFALKHKLLKGRCDPYISVNYIPFWQHFRNWDAAGCALDMAAKCPFLNFEQFRRDVAYVASHSFLAYRRGPEYRRAMAAINLILALDTMNVDAAGLCPPRSGKLTGRARRPARPRRARAGRPEKTPAQAADHSYAFDSAARVDIFAPRAREIFPGCYATGDTVALEARASELQTALAADDLAAFKKTVNECDGAYWGWVKRGQQFFCFNCLWGQVKAYVARPSDSHSVIFESHEDVKDIVPLETNLTRIATYLAFSYLPANDTLFEGISNLPPAAIYELRGTTWQTHGKNDTFRGQPEDLTLEEAAGLIAEEIHASVGRCLADVGPFVLLLSGGIDSRAILSAALEHRPASDIHTFTFGYPGSFDYEIGNQIAKAAGTRHRSAPISIADYTLADVRAAATDTFGQIFYSVEMPVKFAEHLCGMGLPIITGFMGDALSGKRLEPGFLGREITGAWKEELFDYEVMTPPRDLMPVLKHAPFDARELRDHLIEQYMTAAPFAEFSTYANLHDQWDYYNRQKNHDFFANSKRLAAGALYRYPSIAHRITKAYTRLPDEFRCHGKAYRKGVSERYPKLFHLPVASHFGGRIKWRHDTPLRNTANALWFAFKHRMLRGHLDLDSNISYLPFWKYFNENWEVMSFLFEQEARFPFLDFKQIREDIAFLGRHSFYPYKRGPQYARVLGVLNLVLGLHTLGAEVVEQ